jgi:hypothetical protein
VQELPPAGRAALEGLRGAFAEAGGGGEGEGGVAWGEAWEQLWALGPRHTGPAVLLCGLGGYEQLPDWVPEELVRAAPRGPGADAQAARVREMEGSIVSGFQLACAAGPLCEEPIEGAPARAPPRPAPPPAPPARARFAPAPVCVPALGG